MEIVNKETELVRADEVPVGKTFIVDGSLFMATDRTECGSPKCVNLASGKIITVGSDVPVKLTKAKVIIE